MFIFSPTMIRMTYQKLIMYVIVRAFVPLIFLDSSLVDATGEVQYLAADGGLSRINMPNENHIHVVPAQRPLMSEMSTMGCGTHYTLHISSASWLQRSPAPTLLGAGTLKDGVHRVEEARNVKKWEESGRTRTGVNNIYASVLLNLPGIG